MNKIIHYIGLTLFIFLMIGASAAVPAQTSTPSPRAVNLMAPRGDVPLFSFLRTSMIPILFGMKDANFTAGNVLYSEFTTNNDYNQIIGRIVQNSSLSLDLSTFKTNLNNYIASKPGFGNKLQTLYVMTLLKDLQTQIGSNTQLNLNQFTRFDPVKNVNITSHFVVILYDPDKSVINAMNDIRANKTLTSQPFSGDEVLTTVRMDKTVESIYGSYVSRNVFNYGNGVAATAFRDLGIFLNNHPLIGHQIVNALNKGNDSTLSSIRDFVGTNASFDRIIPQTQALRSANIGFSVTQMQLNNVVLGKGPLGNVILKDLNATLVQNQALGITLFNDTNHNGIMDLSMHTVNSNKPGLNGTILPSGSDEAVYQVNFKGAQSASLEHVNHTTIDGQDALNFGFNAQNVSVVLNPVSQSMDNALFQNDSSLTETISNFGYTFHFMPNASSDTVNVKFDYNLGSWSNKTTVNGLGLNQMFITGITDFSGHHRVMTMDHNNQTLGVDNSAAKAGRLVVNAGQSPIAQITLDQNPYTYDGTTQETAYGQTLPLLFANYLFGRITTNGEILNTIGGSATSTKYLYSLSYPEFSGNSISHDPTFAIVAASTSSSSSQGVTSTTKGAPGFELLSIAVLPILVLLKKRKST